MPARRIPVDPPYNVTVSTSIADYRDAIDRLPEGATLVLRDCSWNEYERLLDDLSERPTLRVTYDRGTLEIMSPKPEHEKYARFIDDLVRIVCDARQMELEKVGSATWKHRQLARGTEPDASYYIASAARVIGKRTIDLESDPPPDLVVEIDVTNESLGKFPLYAALSVPEIWRYDGMTAQFYELAGDSYRGIDESRCLRGLTPALVTEALDQSRREGQRAALVTFRQRLEAAR
jgi:Uma2 family endonuclease